MMKDFLPGSDADAGFAEGQSIAEFDVSTASAEGVVGFFGEED